MGADLVGYMFKGPTEFTAGQLLRAKETARARQAGLKQLVALMDEYYELKHADEPPVDAILREADILERMRNTQYGPTAPYVSDGSPKNIQNALDHWDWLVDMDVDSALGEFVEIWELRDSARDTTVRTFEDGAFRVMFAGTQTWGDEPDGQGYQLMKLVDGLHLYSELDLE